MKISESIITKGLTFLISDKKAYFGSNEEEKRNNLSIWRKMFRDYDPKTLETAFNYFAESFDRMPSARDFRQRLNLIDGDKKRQSEKTSTPQLTGEELKKKRATAESKAALNRMASKDFFGILEKYTVQNIRQRLEFANSLDFITEDMCYKIAQAYARELEANHIKGEYHLVKPFDKESRIVFLCERLKKEFLKTKQVKQIAGDPF